MKTKNGRKVNGVILWEGASAFDGAPIAVIATGLDESSANEKTGAMIQTWIIRRDVEPHKALKTGEDSAVCGDCPHRPANGGACYVTVFQAPLSVYRAYHRKAYATIDEFDGNPLTGRIVRIGSYGDPAMVPVSVWESATAGAAGWTGYTHQWRREFAAPLRRFCMASADSVRDMEEARAAGWRTFRVRRAEEPLQAREVICPASAEAGFKTNCATCQACKGADGRRGTIAIVVHGAASKVKAFNRAA